MAMQQGTGKPFRGAMPRRSVCNRLATVLTLCVLGLAACAPGANLPPLDQSVDSVAMPLIGVVRAAGLTPVEFAASIEDQLRKQNLFSKPSVSVEVASYRPIFILGEVAKPGEYQFHPGMTLLSTVSVAGGFTYRAVQDYASIVRKVGDKVVEGKVTRQALIQPGDVITIFERAF